MSNFKRKGRLPERKSLARNQNIASLLHRAHFIEKVGTGISRIRKAIEENGKTNVDFDYNDTFFTVTYRRKIITVGETVGEILKAISQNPKITREQISNKTGLTVRGVEWHLAKLKKRGMLRRIGSSNGGYWEVVINKDENK